LTESFQEGDGKKRGERLSRHHGIDEKEEDMEKKRSQKAPTGKVSLLRQ